MWCEEPAPDNSNVETGSASDLQAFVELLEEAGAALWARGVHQWPPGLGKHQLPQLTQQVEAGRLLLVRRRGSLAGGCIVTSLAPGLWPDRPSDAAYLQKLVIAPSASGVRLGEQIAREAERWSLSRGFTRIRLDCWDLNPRLRRYYRDLGYRELESVMSGTYQARLFEKSFPTAD